MLDIKFIRENLEKVKEGITKKHVEVDIDKLLSFDKQRRELIQKVDELRSKKKIATGKTEEAIKIKSKIQDLEAELKIVEEKFQELMYQVPNLPLDDVPVGKDEKDNVVLREVGKKPKFNFEPKNHLELGKSLDLIDFETGAKVSGSNFYYLKNQAVFLELALVNYALDILKEEKFMPVITPELARQKFYTGTGYLPRGHEAQTYEIKDSDLGLIATSEITLAGIHSDEILEENNLPKKYAGFSHCFRTEAGSYGKYSKGLYRIHQFSKVEMYVYCLPEESDKIHQYLLLLEEKIFTGLKIPYRVLEMCAGDLGAQAAKKFDLEAWMPGRNDWGEITSTSNTTDYQARRLNMKYRKKDGSTKFVHTLNGTAIAIPRAIIAILENYQQKDGTIKIPETLQKYTDFSAIGGSAKSGKVIK